GVSHIAGHRQEPERYRAARPRRTEGHDDHLLDRGVADPRQPRPDRGALQGRADRDRLRLRRAGRGLAVLQGDNSADVLQADLVRSRPGDPVRGRVRRRVGGQGSPDLRALLPGRPQHDPRLQVPERLAGRRRRVQDGWHDRGPRQCRVRYPPAVRPANRLLLRRRERVWVRDPVRSRGCAVWAGCGYTMAVAFRAHPGGLWREYRPAGGRGARGVPLLRRLAVLGGSDEVLEWCTRTDGWAPGCRTGSGRGPTSRAGRGGAGAVVDPDRLHRRPARPRAIIGRRGGARAARAREVGDAEGDGRQTPGAREAPRRAGEEGPPDDARRPARQAGSGEEAALMGTPAGFTLGELAKTLGATLEGDPGRRVTGVAPLDAAGPEQISFLIDARYRPAAETSRAGALLVSEQMSGLAGPLLRSSAPQQALIALLTLFHPPAPTPAGIDSLAIVARDAHVDPSASIGALAVIASGAVIGPRVRVHPLVYIGPFVEVGEESVLHPRVVLCEGVRLGRRVVVQPGAVIGGDGFGYVFDGGGHRKIPQVGTVVIEDDVDIGANTTIDRAMLGRTIVRRGTKIDNLVQVGHN